MLRQQVLGHHIALWRTFGVQADILNSVTKIEIFVDVLLGYNSAVTMLRWTPPVYSLKSSKNMWWLFARKILCPTFCQIYRLKKNMKTKSTFQSFPLCIVSPLWLSVSLYPGLWLVRLWNTGLLLAEAWHLVLPWASWVPLEIWARRIHRDWCEQWNEIHCM